MSTKLSELPKGAPAVVRYVKDSEVCDRIARRLRDLGFVAGEPVRVIARALGGVEPLLIQIGPARFALRRAEAARIIVSWQRPV